MEKSIIIGIMGPGANATKADLKVAFQLGKKLAEKQFLVLTGGRSQGVMEAAMKGAKAGGGTTIGILPSEDGSDRSEFVDIPIKTGMGSARNNINVLTADIVIAVGLGPGTASEISLAIKAKKPVILLNWTDQSKEFFELFDTDTLNFCNSVNDILSLLTALKK